MPVMICERGYFIYYGDFNAQQIPFYSLSNDAVRSGQLGWNWFTDLGSDWLTSYSFYLAASPFFWLTTILPRAAVPYSIPFLLALKHGLASLTAYAYIRRFVRGKEAALVGALLYSFSGFQVFNLFFNHFQDVTALFPLMLIALEENINNRRRGWFAVIVAVMAALNYYFFAGEAVFLIAYFFFRLPCRDFRASWSRFLGLLFEALVGIGIACVVLLPSALAILGNYRVNERLWGIDWVLFREPSRVIRVIQTFFMPSDAPARPNLFKSEQAKWSSVGGYFPLFGMLGVIAFFRTHRRHWAVKVSVFCIVCSFVPILNSMFYTFNASYYARWFFMPILILAMMTAVSLDDERADFSPAIKLSALALACFGAISLIPEKEDGKLRFFTLPYDFIYFCVQLAIAVIFLIFAAYLLRRRRKGLTFEWISTVSTSLASIACILAVVVYGAVTPKGAREYIDSAINGKENVYESVSEDNFFRADISEDCDNYPMLWGLPCMRCFQSVVSTSIMEFYDSIGIQRDVASRADISHYTLRGLLSVKYFYREIEEGWSYEEMQAGITPPSSSESENRKFELEASKADITKYLSGFEYIGTRGDFEVYENTLYVPMGFTYDSCLTESAAEDMSDSARERVLMKALILSDEQAEKYSDIIAELPPDKAAKLTKSDYERFCREKQRSCADSFTYDSHGFTSEITLAEPKLVFFSVPYSEGWTAEVNGKPADVEKVSYGFMAVKADAGTNNIVFRYRTPGLRTGAFITLGSALLLIAYLLIMCPLDRKRREIKRSHCYDYEPLQKVTASEVYTRSFIRGVNDKK
ncbi:MAG: YfhO family protein [Ruminococcus sp.]|nr:YfhO family protein [Ruminococcus sp.]